MSADHKGEPKPLLQRFILPALIVAALASLLYGTVTSPSDGRDLLAFHQGATDWLVGDYSLNEGSIAGYPPFAVPVFAPLALIPFKVLIFIWVLVNLVTTAITLLLTIRLFGASWRLVDAIFLAAFFIAWAPFRVTLRVGQISMLTLALLLGALLARRHQREILAGLLLVLSLTKYTMTFPFFLYFVWKRNWKAVGAAIIVAAILTEVFAFRLGVSLTTLVKDYFHLIQRVQTAPVEGFIGTTEIKMLLLDITGGHEYVTLIITIVLMVGSLIAMAITFRRTKQNEHIHFAILSLFALWTGYHRTYDSVLCLLPAAVFVDFIVRKRFVKFARAGLAGLSLFILSIPGVLTGRLGIEPARLSANPLGFIGLHLERMLVFAMFCSLLVLLWKGNQKDLEALSQGAEPDLGSSRRQSEPVMTGGSY